MTFENSIFTRRTQGALLALAALRAKMADVRRSDRARELDLELGFDENGKQVEVRKSSPEELMIAEQMLQIEAQIKEVEMERVLQAQAESRSSESVAVVDDKAKPTAKDTSRDDVAKEVGEVVKEISESYKKAGISCEVSAKIDLSNKVQFVVNFGGDKEFSASLEELQKKGIADQKIPGTSPSNASSRNLQGREVVTNLLY